MLENIKVLLTTLIVLGGIVAVVLFGYFLAIGVTVALVGYLIYCLVRIERDEKRGE